ncbi:hypothetical protein [Pedobacter sp. Leaf194]|uniref:hypothetical protein n=1 Tax=Pedobacter sp. Leaf194 TaxID=1736297 RepID=UPI000AF2D4FB|nr:hypothetical protein [Pedobacter sp. Leaf194]
MNANIAALNTKVKKYNQRCAPKNLPKNVCVGNWKTEYRSASVLKNKLLAKTCLSSDAKAKKHTMVKKPIIIKALKNLYGRKFFILGMKGLICSQSTKFEKFMTIRKINTI